MPRQRVPYVEIQSLQPALNYKKANGLGVIGGKNFAWDAAGVRSDFASRLIAADTKIANFGEYVQSVKIADGYHVIAGPRVYRFVPEFAGARAGTWQQIATLTPVQTPTLSSIPEYLRAFTSFYLAGYAYVSHWNYGTYRVNVATGAYTRLTSLTTPGFPSDAEPVYGVAESNGRAVYLTKTTAYWSAPADPENLVPALGGAGFQVIGERIAGEPRTILRVNAGIVIWTTAGALAAEFTANDAVFRWFQLTVDIMPLNQAACVEMPDGGYLVLTRLGVFRVVDLGQPQQISPLFGEFIREHVRSKPIESAALWYSQSDNRVFAAMRQANARYVETFCLDVALDKWGIFSHVHSGLILYASTRSQIGYVDQAGIASYLLPHVDPNKTREDSSAPGTYLGLDSQVEIGFIRSEQMVLDGDAVGDLTDVNLYRHRSIEGSDDTFEDEGLFIAAVLPTYDVIDEGLMADYNSLTAEIYDEGLMFVGIADGSYKVEFVSDIYEDAEVGGVNFGVRPATLVHAGKEVDAWTGGCLGHYIKLRVSATEPGESFRLHALDATLAYAGQML